MTRVVTEVLRTLQFTFSSSGTGNLQRFPSFQTFGSSIPGDLRRSSKRGHLLPSLIFVSSNIGRMMAKKDIAESLMSFHMTVCHLYPVHILVRVATMFLTSNIKVGVWKCDLYYVLELKPEQRKFGAVVTISKCRLIFRKQRNKIWILSWKENESTTCT